MYTRFWLYTDIYWYKPPSMEFRVADTVIESLTRPPDVSPAHAVPRLMWRSSRFSPGVIDASPTLGHC